MTTTIQRVTDEYSACGLPLALRTNGLYADAIAVTVRHLADIRFERAPTPAELRLVCEYCAYFINAPAWVLPKRELAMLRASVIHIATVADLANWLWGCKQIGLRPL
jgi:hypothetical protein